MKIENRKLKITAGQSGILRFARNDKRGLACMMALGLALAVLSINWACNQAPYLRAAQAAKDLVLAVGAFQDVEIELHGQSLISDAEHQAIEGELVKVADAGKQLDNAIRVAHSQPNAQTALAASIDAADQLLNGIGGVKNPQAKARLEEALVAIKGFLATIAAVTA